jgi:dTDP-4-dehydrorhamnose reductase
VGKGAKRRANVFGYSLFALVMTRYDALVIGGDGLVGGEIVLALRGSGYAVRATSRRAGSDALALDLAEPDLRFMQRERYGCAFICAGITNMRDCERMPDDARRVNVEGTLKIMRALAAAGTHLVFLSSGQVFDGELPRPAETATRRPKNLYGRHKLEVEEVILRAPAGSLSADHQDSCPLSCRHVSHLA